MACQSNFERAMANLKEESYSYASMDKVLSNILLLCRDVKMREKDKIRLRELFDKIEEMRMEIINLGIEVTLIGHDYGAGYHIDNYFHPDHENLYSLMSEKEIQKELDEPIPGEQENITKNPKYAS